MNTGGLAVDISLLAVLIALHATKKNNNLELVVMALLFAHLIMTTEAFSMTPSEEVYEEVVGVVKDVKDEVNEVNEVKSSNKSKVKSSNKSSNKTKSVSDGGFDRAFQNIPTEVNLDLAKARTSFFKEMFPNK